MIIDHPTTIVPDPLEEGCLVTRCDHKTGFRAISVELPFGVSRAIPARSHPSGQPNHWLSEGQTIVGDEEHVVRVLTDKLVSEILDVEARRCKREDSQATAALGSGEEE
jgi:hypothetical protein